MDSSVKWYKTIGATTAPNGYEWVNNGESRFSGKRKIWLKKISKPIKVKGHERRA